ncbi:MAG: hypothetical protein AAFY98_07465 [Verrucomicrobiota bacterium]
MDSDDICFLANSFKEYISQGCGIDVDKLNSLVEEESSMPGSFAQFVKEHFSTEIFIDDDRIESLNLVLNHHIKRKPEQGS